MVDGCLYFSINANMQHLKWTSGSADATKATLGFVTNVTQDVKWPITSYGVAGGKSPARRSPINRFGKKNSYHFNIEIEKLTHWFNFWISIILSAWPNDDNHYTLSIFTYLFSENVRSFWYSRGTRYATEIRFFLRCYQPFVFHRKPNGRPMNKMKQIKR